MVKFISIGTLIGITVGVASTLLFPELLSFGLDYSRLGNEQLGFPRDFYLPKSGSVYNSLMVFPFFTGLSGGILGFIAYKINQPSYK